MKQKLKVIKKNGFTLKIDGFTRPILKEIWHKHVYDFPKFAVSRKSTVIDIGANYGFYSIYAARNGATVYAFEPNYRNFKILKWNIKKNNLSNLIKAFNTAVSDVNGQVSLFIPTKCSRAFIVCSTSRPYLEANRNTWFKRGYIAKKVDSISLKSIFKKFNIRHCDLLKMDCQGAEYDIFKSAHIKTLQQIKRIVVETHKGYKDAELIKLLKGARFKIVLFKSISKDIYGKGLIKALRE